MAETKKAAPYRTFIGVVQFEPREGEAAGKTVRNIAIRTHGVKEQSMRVSATLWPEFDHVEVDKGDAVVVEGKFTRNEGTNGDGEKVFYNNLSVSSILVLGRMDDGAEIETTQTSRANPAPADDADDAADDDDIPY